MSIKKIISKFIRFYGILFFAAIIIGCDAREVSQVNQVLWSDDDSSQAIVVLTFDEKPAMPGDGTTQKDNFRHHVFTQNPDGSGRKEIIGMRKYQNGANNYYMKSEGYILLEIIEGQDKLRYDIIRLDGNVSTFLRWENPGSICKALETSPSPDGKQIAVVERIAEEINNGFSCSQGVVVIKFYDSHSLNQIGNDQIINNKEMIESTWTLGGKFIVSEYNGSAWEVKPDSYKIADSVPACFFPKTTSSAVSSSGVMIIPGDMNNPVNVIDVDEPPIFGCY